MTHLASKMLFNKILNSEFGFRLDSSYILNYTTYNKITSTLKQLGIDIVKLSKFTKVRKKGISGKTATILIRSLWKASIHPLKIEVRTHGSRFLCKELDIIGVATGLGSIGKFSIVPKYLSEIIEQPLATTADLIILEPIPNEKRGTYYIVTLLNTRIGRVISSMLTYGSTGQLHLDAKWLEDIKIPIIDNYGDIIKDMESAIEDYEAKAWKAYFKAIKIVEEYLSAKDVSLAGTSSLKIMEQTGRIDATMHILLALVSRLGKGNICHIGELYDILSGTAPSSREYKKPCEGQKYISTKSIDESGYIDEEGFYCYPGRLRTRNLAKRGSLVTLKNAHSVEALGKTGIVYPYDNVPAISDLYILNPKPSIDEDISFYTIALSKTKLFKRMVQSLAYGLTAHIKAEDLARIPIPFIDQWKEVARYMKEFIENMYQANVLKIQAIMELENQILKLLG